MITNLHIKNIGIIDDLEVDMNRGMNVLTGETGAGKSLIIDALGIICGGRFSKEMIRKGENYSYVELCMYAPNDINSVDENIIITREIYSNGRNLCKINGRLVTVAELRNFMSNYIEIHGQNDNQQILDSRTHIKYLDNFSGDKLIGLKLEYKEKYIRYNEIKRELRNNYGDEKEKQRKLDLLKYQLNEIQDAKLKVGEEEKLEERRKIIVNSEKIAKNLSEADGAIGENTIDAIGIAIRALEKIESIDNKYGESANSLRDIYYQIQEISRDVNEYMEDVDFDEKDREKIETRLDIIDNLKRKYGNNIEEILKYSDEINCEINKIENAEEYNEKLRKEIFILEEKMISIANNMHDMREKMADTLNKKINKELADLEMPNARFITNIKKVEFNPNGIDEVEYFICTNIGEEAKKLDKIASGGEMSRIMLAIKTVLADTDSTPILIFDEIDTGISGKAAKSVGEKLKLIGKNHQVLCITHQPSIAAKGDQNYYISKDSNNGRTFTKIKKLTEEEIINEVARISNGEVTEIAKKHALELRKSA